MTHEIKLLFETVKSWQLLGKQSVLVSVVALDGSSYRRPGVRMIINEDGVSVGAVSGGCIEKEIEHQAQSVFRSGKAKMMTYDGRLRIGCEGIILILIEPVFLTSELLTDIESSLKRRKKFRMDVYYYNSVGEYKNAGTLITLNEKTYSLNPSFHASQVEDQECFSQSFDPLFQLYIFGAEHDAVQLCQAAKLLGWEVIIVASAEESKSCDYFPGAASLITPAYNDVDISVFDEQTAVVLMTHSFNKDVQYLISMKDSKPAYLGLVGSIKRRERVLSMLLEYCPDISPDFLEQIYGPAGINIGAESASEIAISILSEILGVIRNKKPEALRNKVGSIHD
jgi:xanthine/CO dehydrogenase XdhC/CoxF family maturation factor